MSLLRHRTSEAKTNLLRLSGSDTIQADFTAKSKTHLSKAGADSSKEETERDTGIILFLFISDGSTAKKTEKKSVCRQRGYPETGSEDRTD